MSIRPFTSNEIESLKEAIEKNGWKIESRVEDCFRYTINKNNILIFTIKFPIELKNVRLNVPYEVASFKISIAFKIWHLNKNTSKIIIYLLKALKELADQVILEPDFPVEGRLQNLMNILKVIVPDVIKNENERAWLNRIRTSLMNKRGQYSDQFQEFDSKKLIAIIDRLKESGLKPTFDQPWELQKGLPKIRTSETLFFSNEDENFDEFFIVEKGFITYFKDLAYNKFYIRTLFETYNPYILYSTFEFQDASDYKFETSIQNWIKVARLLLNSIIEIINEGNINQNEFIRFKPEKELELEHFEEKENVFPFSALHYESSIAKELFPIHNDLFDSPPVNYEVIDSSINFYTKAEAHIRRYEFDAATKVLNEALKIFNKNRQKKAVVSVLLLLRKIASRLNQEDLAQNYLENALSIMKSSELPIKYIIDIQYKLGKTYFMLNDFTKSLHHLNILISFLEKEKKSLVEEQNLEMKKTLQKRLGMAYIYVGLINLEQNKIADSKSNFKKAFQIGSESLTIKLRFFLYRAIAFKNKGNISQALKLLKMGLNTLELEDSDALFQKLQEAIWLELSDIHINHRKNKNKAFFYLQRVGNRISNKSIQELQVAIRWNMLMKDFFSNLEKDREQGKYYFGKAEDLKVKLRQIGVMIF